MTKPLNTYGYEPDTQAMRASVVDGWLVSLTIEPHEEKPETMCACTYRTWIGGDHAVGEVKLVLGVPLSIGEAFIQSFEAEDGPREALQMILDESHGALHALNKNKEKE